MKKTLALISIVTIVIFMMLKLSNYTRTLTTWFNNPVSENISENIIELLKTEKEINIQGIKNNAIVLNFWGTWCAPCIKEIPELNEFVSKYINADIMFIAATSEDSADVANFLDKNKLSFNYLKLYNQAMLSDYFFYLNPKKSGGHNLTKAYPMNIVINKKGELVYCSQGYSEKQIIELEQAIIAVLGLVKK